MEKQKKLQNGGESRQKKLFSGRNFKFGSAAVLLSIALVAVVLVVNIAVSGLAQRFDWYFDMSGSGIYGLSDAATSMLDTLEPVGDVTIYFLTDPDMLSGDVKSTNYLGQSSAWGMRPIHEVALEIAEKYSFVSVEYLNYAKDPRTLREIVGEDYESITFASTQVLVDCKTTSLDQSGAVYDSAHSWRIFSRDAFYTFDFASSSYNYVTSFCGDYRLASAIGSVSVGGDAPVAYFMSGHGEPIGSYDPNSDEKESSSFSSAQSLWQILRDCGYTVKRIDLRYEDFGDESDALCIIYSPITDLLAPANSDSFNEVEKLESFLGEAGHSLMVFADPDTGKLSNLASFLNDNCGITLSGDKLKDSGKNSLSVDRLTFVGTPSQASPIADALSGGYASGHKTVFSSAQAIKIDGTKNTLSICDVPDSVSDDSAKGSSLMTLTEISGGGRILVCGSSKFVSESCIDTPTYANRENMLLLIDELSDGASPTVGLEYDLIENDTLDITSRQATIATLLLAVLLPIVVMALGTVVYLKRRHS